MVGRRRPGVGTLGGGHPLPEEATPPSVRFCPHRSSIASLLEELVGDATPSRRRLDLHVTALLTLAAISASRRKARETSAASLLRPAMTNEVGSRPIPTRPHDSCVTLARRFVRIVPLSSLAVCVHGQPSDVTSSTQKLRERCKKLPIRTIASELDAREEVLDNPRYESRRSRRDDCGATEAPSAFEVTAEDPRRRQRRAPAATLEDDEELIPVRPRALVGQIGGQRREEA